MRIARAAVGQIAILALLLMAPTMALAVEILQGPTLAMDPNGLTPLAGVVELETDEPVGVQLTISGGADVWTVNFPDAALEHYLPVLGLKSNRAYTVDVDLIPGGFAGSLLAVTPPLPANFPLLVTLVADPTKMEPGFTLIDAVKRGTQWRYAMIVDEAGEVVWYTPLELRPAQQMANGNLFYRSMLNAMEVDMLGNTKLAVGLTPPAGSLHHDLLRTPHGTYLSLSSAFVQVPDFPTSETNPAAPTADATVLDDPVVEFLPDGTLRNEWLLTDIIHPTRIGYDSLFGGGGGFDWAHGNGVIYDPSDDSIIVSARHQDALIKFSRSTGDLVWILGPHDNWPPQFQPYLLHPVGTPFRWSYHQHAPMITGDGTIVLFDNGNHRASPFDGNPDLLPDETFSRAVEYEIDPLAMTIEQVWEYGEQMQDTLFSASRGDADWLATTGNVLLTFSSVSYVGGVSSSSAGLGAAHVRIVEATDDPVPETVFELLILDPAGVAMNGNRSERIPSLYPLQGGDVRYMKPPNAVGQTLTLDRSADSTMLEWGSSPVDSQHDAAEYYIVYASSSPGGGFAMLDSTAGNAATSDSVAELVFYKIVAANTAGTSGDEPSP